MPIIARSESQELLDNPNETLDVEYKEWRDFSGGNWRETISGGERGIRTLDTPFWAYAPLAGECLRPLGHLSDLNHLPFLRARRIAAGIVPISPYGDLGIPRPLVGGLGTAVRFATASSGMLEYRACLREPSIHLFGRMLP